MQPPAWYLQPPQGTNTTAGPNAHFSSALQCTSVRSDPRALSAWERPFAPTQPFGVTASSVCQSPPAYSYFSHRLCYFDSCCDGVSRLFPSHKWWLLKLVSPQHEGTSRSLWGDTENQKGLRLKFSSGDASVFSWNSNRVACWWYINCVCSHK